MVKDTCLIVLRGIDWDPQSLGLEIPRIAASAWKHLMRGIQAHNLQNAINILCMTNLKRRE
jgi:hypothetical protein